MDAAAERESFLRDTQNRDGGWGYFPGKNSWLEPTVYAALALRNNPAVMARVWPLLHSWALPEGGWRTSAEVPDPNWATSLVITLYCVAGSRDDALRKGIDRMLMTVGAEGSFALQLDSVFAKDVIDLDFGLQGWPWRSGNASWVEPTAHAAVALRKVASSFPADWIPHRLTLERRVEVAEKMLLERRCVDGGWNYGNKRVRQETLPSYPETTAIALLGLLGRDRHELQIALDVLQRNWRETRIPLALAWTAITMRNFGLPLIDRQMPPTVRPLRDIMLTALQLIGETADGAATLGIHGSTRISRNT